MIRLKNKVTVAEDFGATKFIDLVVIFWRGLMPGLLLVKNSVGGKS